MSGKLKPESRFYLFAVKHKAELENIPWSIFWSWRRKPLIWLYKEAIGVGWVWPLMFGLGALLFTDFKGPNPLEWRSFNQGSALMNWAVKNLGWSDYSNHHFLNLVAEAGVCFALAFWFARQEHRSFVHYGFLATYGAVFVWSIHEGMWWVTYIFTAHFIYGQTLLDKWFTGLGEIFVFSLILFTAVSKIDMLVGGKGKTGLYWPWKFTAIMLAFYLVWIAAGFPITESYLGNTWWYGTIWGDSWEVSSWWVAAVAFFVYERKPLLKWFQDIRAIALKPGV